jgi:hypothetical protein
MLAVLEERANVSVARGHGFGLLAIFAVMVGCSSDIVLALKSGGLLCLVMCAALVLKAWRADRRPYKTTELWLMLAPSERPHASIAQQVIANVLREAYLRFARHSAWLAAGLLGGALVLGALPR